MHQFSNGRADIGTPIGKSVAELLFNRCNEGIPAEAGSLSEEIALVAGEYAAELLKQISAHRVDGLGYLTEQIEIFIEQGEKGRLLLATNQTDLPNVCGATQLDAEKIEESTKRDWQLILEGLSLSGEVKISFNIKASLWHERVTDGVEQGWELAKLLDECCIATGDSGSIFDPTRVKGHFQFSIFDFPVQLQHSNFPSNFGFPSAGGVLTTEVYSPLEPDED